MSYVHVSSQKRNVGVIVSISPVNIIKNGLDQAAKS